MDIPTSSDFVNKIKSFTNIHSNLILVIADVVGLYPNSLHEPGLNAIKEAFDNKERKSVRVITLNLMEKLNSYPVRLLGLNMHHHINAYIWIKYRHVSLKV